MALFSLEVLKAKGGDCFLLHFGRPEDPRLMLIDGGPEIAYRSGLAQRLRQLREDRELDTLVLELAVVAHADSQHMGGIVQLLRDLADERARAEVEIRELWHNSLDALFDNFAGALLESAAAEVGDAAIGLEVPSAGLSREASTVLASVGEARSLARLAERLALPLNRRLGVLTSDLGTVALGGGLELTVLSPDPELKKDLTATWERELERLSSDLDVAGGAAAYADASAYRLASLVLVAQSAGRRMLLPGDARSDDILAGLARAGLLADGKLHVDLLKLPGHGSDRNVNADFFAAVTADHYVVSADGRHGNPDPSVFAMIRAARPREPYTVWLTYPPEHLESASPTGAELRRVLRRETVRHIAEDEISIVIDLDEPVLG
ncbi:MAG: hypothetical protein OES32_07445 [Acidobacteriota bacterium]|nr:hypothetical protein [Acidobacteriota bacterium]